MPTLKKKFIKILQLTRVHSKNLRWALSPFLLPQNLDMSRLLCILTSKQVLHTPFAGQNQFFDAKKIFTSFLVRKCFYFMFLHVFVWLCFLFSLISLVSDGKSCFMVKNLISICKRHAEHPFTGRNTLQSS